MIRRFEIYKNGDFRTPADILLNLALIAIVDTIEVEGAIAGVTTPCALITMASGQQFITATPAEHIYSALDCAPARSH